MIELLILHEFVIRYLVKYESYIAEKDLSTSCVVMMYALPAQA